MGSKQNKCCCGVEAYWLYACYFGDTDIYRIDPETGAYTLWSTGTVLGGRAIACDPDGSVYVAGNSGADVTIHKLDASASVVWSSTKTAIGLAYGIAVTNDGFVYICTRYSGGISGVYKFDAASGSENTDDDWPYVVGSVDQRIYLAICVDQSGNVYIGANHTSHTIRAIALDSTGAVIWTSAVSAGGGADTAINGGVYGIAVNAAGTQVHCVRATDSSTQPNIHELYSLDATTGAITGSVNTAGSPGSLQNGNSATYDTAGNFYSGISIATGGWQIYKNGATHLKEGLAQIYAMACGHDDNVFSSGVRGSSPWDVNIYSITKGWGINLSPKSAIAAMDVSTGRIGAFGI